MYTKKSDCLPVSGPDSDPTIDCPILQSSSLQEKVRARLLDSQRDICGIGMEGGHSLYLREYKG